MSFKSPYYCAIWPGVIYQNVTPDYFRTYGIKLITTYGILMTYGVISGGFRGLSEMRVRSDRG
jgi:hypothetical protein